MAIQKKDNKKQSIITASQTLTGSYADIGSIDGAPYINVMDCDSVTLWIKLDINDSTGVKFRMVGVNSEADSDLYRPVIKSVSPSQVAVQPNEVLLSLDIDQNILLSFSTADQIPLVKFQVMATVVGATAGQILDCGITFTSLV